MNTTKKIVMPLIGLHTAALLLASCSSAGNERNARWFTENFPVLSWLIVIGGIGVMLYGIFSNLNTPMAILIGAGLIALAIILF